MSFVMLPAILTVVLVVYLIYLYFWKKDAATFKAVLYPGLFFVLAWVILYWFIFK
ncbi:hypothetical protein NOV28_05830 [Kaistella montana]|uniref:hypothetical protein n=1 Tax=Kaistella montana TaxID=1849733 RepID=UPI00210CA49D|nr:hypothetical protein [Kaistella montana]MCQ4035300.1 hypothetical protein [Kaistella montana]